MHLPWERSSTGGTHGKGEEAHIRYSYLHLKMEQEGGKLRPSALRWIKKNIGKGRAVSPGQSLMKSKARFPLALQSTA